MSQNTQEPDSSPDLAIVDLVTKSVLSNYTIDDEILRTWSTELADVAGDSKLLATAIQNSILVSLPLENAFFDHSHESAWSNCLSMLNDLDNDVYSDFKSIIYELLLQAIRSNTARLQMLEFDFIDVFADDYLANLEDLHSPQKTALLSALLELNCPVKTLKKLLSPLLEGSARVSASSKLILLEYLTSIVREFPSHFTALTLNNFRNKNLPLPLSKEFNSKCFTVQAWLKVDDPVENLEEDGFSVIPLFSLADASSGASTSIRVQLLNYTQFMVEVVNKSTGSRMQYSFNQHLDRSSPTNQGFTLFTLTYDYLRNINLFINGQKSESIPCTSIAKEIGSWNKLYIGNPESEDFSKSKRDELLLKDLIILDSALSEEWILTSCALGVGFNWGSKDLTEETIPDLFNHLNPVELTDLGAQFSTLGLSSDPRRQHSGKSKSDDQIEVLEKPDIVHCLNKSKFSRSSILFDSNESDFLDHVRKAKSKEYIALVPDSLNGGLYCLGGASFLLTLVDTMSNDPQLERADRGQLTFKSLELLLECLRNSWRIYKEFEKNDGFCILVLLLKQYKERYNGRLEFDGSLLELFQSFAGYDANTKRGFIKNALAFKLLVLDFHLYDGTVDQELLKTSIVDMVSSVETRDHNLRMLSRLKLLKRLVHFMEFKLLSKKASDKEIEEFSDVLDSILRTDISLDTIRSFSHFIIFAIYRSEESGLISQKIGYAALDSLTSQLCDSTASVRQLKKFSRALTIHWLLLLLNFRSGGDDVEAKQFDKKIVCRGLTLLIRLLRILGPRISKKFFQLSRGLDVLTHSLKVWWSDDEIISLLFLAGFGLDTRVEELPISTLPQILEVDKVKSIKTLVAPEFILLLNNMVLSSMYDLSVRHGRVLSVPNSPQRSQHKNSQEEENFAITFNAIHLINQYIDTIKAGFNVSPALTSFFTSREWLEGIYELQGHLKLSIDWSEPTFKKSFRKASEKLSAALSDIFISKMHDVKMLFRILEPLNESTLKMILDSTFPRIFSHVNHFFTDSSSMGNEADLLDGTSDLLLFYFEHFIDANYNVSNEDMDTFVNAALNVLEANNQSKRRQHGQQKLKSVTGRALVLKLSKFPSIGTESDSETEGEEPLKQQLDEVVKFLLYKQIVFLDPEVLNETLLAQVFEVLIVQFSKLKMEKQFEIAEHFINFLRAAYMMREGTFDSVIEQLTSASDYSNSDNLIRDFLNILVSRNDEDIIRHLHRYPAIRHIFSKNLHFRLSKLKDVGKINVLEMTRVMLNNGGRLGYMDTIYIKSFEKDCEKLRVKIINEELTNHNRELQDIDDNNNFFSTSFANLKSEITRLFYQHDLAPPSYMLDYIEGTDRMRKLLVIEDHLAESDKLTYSIDIPVKKIKAVEMDMSDFQSYEYAISQANVGELSLVDNPEDEFEEIEIPSESGGSEGTDFEDKNRRVLRSLYMGDQIQHVWNISRINGLEIVESLMILGVTHLYLIENYFHCSDGNVIDACDAPSELRDPYLHLINSQSNGTSGNTKTHRTKSWSLEKLSSITKRKFLLRDIALEMFFSDGASILITCLSNKQRNVVNNKLSPYASGKGLDKDLAMTLENSSQMSHSNSQSNNSSLTSRLTSAFTNNFNANSGIASVTKKWQQGEMSNFYYLMLINTMAGRTFNDLTQYPVFPWVLADYESEELDLSDPKVFRDLSKPMGAQNAARASQFAERYEALSTLDDSSSPPFHYGTHYSSAMIVSSYMIRLKPYVQSYLLLQGGKFDHADRLFYSIEKAWSSASKDNTTDVRELTPEFFYLPEFLENQNNFEFGALQTGKVIHDVELPKWSKGDPKIFVARNREALESPYVSANLHKWIDLVFGYKQTGEEAVKALNVFHHSSYEGAVNLDDVVDDVERRAVIGMINNFGQTPMRIFNKPHAAREVLNGPDLYLQMLDTQKHPPARTFESKLNMPIEKLEVSAKTKKWIGRPSCVSSEDDLLIRKPSSQRSLVGSGSLIINTSSFMNLHSSNITAIVQLGDKTFVTGASDGVIQVWKYFAKPHPTVRFQHILRGHESEIKALKYSKTFKIGVSLDSDENVIVWDFSRFMFVRKLRAGNSKRSIAPLHVSVSNDTGNITILSSTRYANTIEVFTINGQKIIEKQLAPGRVSAVNFAGLNGTLVGSPNDIRHVYWNHEIVAVAYETPRKVLQFYELECSSKGWQLSMLQSVALDNYVGGCVTSLEVFKRAEADKQDKLCRGSLAAVLGDSQGKVYVIAEN
ncbi:hypothetical protein CA3LBN_001857 [Candidozyma haemuli]|uniref:Beach-domain-containing protein n=1 Tax=Candidozyma haemuli TaxID=45357 RepID=A0ABX8I3K9_9ASCO|nr:hypothetical protein CA3LBN_001857 [[Candida] haemuloni]